MWSPANLDDVPAITGLQARSDTYWFGAAEQDEDEVRHGLALVEPLTERSRVARDANGAVVAAAWWMTVQDTALVVEPEHPRRQRLLDDAVSWFEASGARSVESLARDTELEQVLQARGWIYQHSSFELLRMVSQDWALAPPNWPQGVHITAMRPGDPPAVHDLIYRRARWADVPGHHERDLDQWQRIFVDDHPPEQQVLAWDGDLLVGSAIGKAFSDGTGWVAQLAVAQDRQGCGLGRALLTQALLRRIESGAARLGLGVSADNPQALGLYQDVGLLVDREWRTYARPD